MSAGPSIQEVSSYLKKNFVLEKFQTGAGSGAARAPTNVTPITAVQAQNILTSYDSMTPPNTQKRSLGTITTLLDLTNRDLQENDLFPLTTDITWFTRDTERRILPFTPSMQEIPLRGPGAFGQRFSFDLGSLVVGDILLGTALQIRLRHWLDPQTELLLEVGQITYDVSGTAWEYANSLGTSIIQQAELEIDGKTIETIDGDFIHVYNSLYSDANETFGIAYDHTGRISMPRMMNQQIPRLYPTEDGTINCLLPFFYMRCHRQDGLPMIAVRENIVKIHITLRPFEECVRQLRGYRDTCASVPLQTSINFHKGLAPYIANTEVSIPGFQFVQLLTQGAIVNGPLRQRMLHDPFEILHREVQIFYFEEPLKYSIGKRAADDIIRIQLPLEANHPIEEIIWFVRRKGVRDNNAWTNYTAVLDAEWSTQKLAARSPLLQNAILQANGVTLCDADEQYYRQHIAGAHRGGISAYNQFIYGYSFAKTPGEHQPSGSFNASRLSSLRLILDVKPPGGILDANWEVKVFCIALNWLRFENGIANPMFED